MLTYSKTLLGERAKELHVVRDTLEKVCRLRDILAFFDSSELLRNSLALKGGTAINLLFFNLPRLSVDIDLDFCDNTSKEEMLERREKIRNQIFKFTTAEGYSINPKSKTPHSLDSFVFDYINAAGVHDNIKIEINYSLRAHIFPPIRQKMQSAIFDGDFEVNTLSAIEIYATKTVALMTRAAARDLYDLNYMIRHGLFDESEREQYRKCVIFYLAIATETTPTELSYAAIDTITPYKITTDLKPVIRDRDIFELDQAKHTVLDFLENTLFLLENEQEFLRRFKQGYYQPELLFDDEDVLKRVSNHPMARWKVARISDQDAR